MRLAIFFYIGAGALLRTRPTYDLFVEGAAHVIDPKTPDQTISATIWPSQDRRCADDTVALRSGTTGAETFPVQRVYERLRARFKTTYHPSQLTHVFSENHGPCWRAGTDIHPEHLLRRLVGRHQRG